MNTTVLYKGLVSVSLQHQTLTVSGVRQATANAAQTSATAAVAAATASQVPAQVVQLGMAGMQQAAIPVQIPISTTGGGTIFQTIPFPVQIMPNVVHANGQTLQVIPQLAQVRGIERCFCLFVVEREVLLAFEPECTFFPATAGGVTTPNRPDSDAQRTDPAGADGDGGHGER